MDRPFLKETPGDTFQSNVMNSGGVNAKKSQLRGCRSCGIVDVVFDFVCLIRREVSSEGKV